MKKRLKDFITEECIECHEQAGGNVFMFIPFDLIEGFSTMINSVLRNGYINIMLRDTFVVVPLNSICEFYEIELNEIFE